MKEENKSNYTHIDH